MTAVATDADADLLFSSGTGCRDRGVKTLIARNIDKATRQHAIQKPDLCAIRYIDMTIVPVLAWRAIRTTIYNLLI